MRAKGRPRHFAISSHWVQGSPLPKEREKREPHGGFHIQLSSSLALRVLQMRAGGVEVIDAGDAAGGFVVEED